MQKDKAYLKDMLDAISDIEVGRTKWLIKSMARKEKLISLAIARVTGNL